MVILLSVWVLQLDLAIQLLVTVAQILPSDGDRSCTTLSNKRVAMKTGISTVLHWHFDC